MNIFEQASREAIRFKTARGAITTEDLWNLPLTSAHAPNLDDIAKIVNEELVNHESFVNPNATNAKAQLALDIVKHVIAFKLNAKEKKRKTAEDKARADLLTSILAEKEFNELKSLPVKDIKKELKKLIK